MKKICLTCGRYSETVRATEFDSALFDGHENIFSKGIDLDVQRWVADDGLFQHAEMNAPNNFAYFDHLLHFPS